MTTYMKQKLEKYYKVLNLPPLPKNKSDIELLLLFKKYMAKEKRKDTTIWEAYANCLIIIFDGDIERLHAVLDDLVAYLLELVGYDDLVKLINSQEKWYA